MQNQERSRFGLKQPAIGLLAAMLLFSDARMAWATNILLNHNDAANDGQNLTESVLTPTSVSTSFGKLFSVTLDGPDLAQPLIRTGVTITAGAFTGVHDVAVVGTENDSLYAIDANNGAVLWHISLLHSFHGGTPSVRSGWWSVTDTPAIDPATNVIYVESAEVENGNSIHVLSAVNLADGTFYANPVNIAESTATPTYVSGPTTASGRKFDAYDLSSRCLTLNPVNHVVYMAYGAPGTPVGIFNGWIIGYGTTKDGANNLPLKAVWCATPNGRFGGIWQGGGGIAIDANGNLFVETGDGYFETNLVTPAYITDGRLTSLTNNATIPGGLKVPSPGDYGDSIVKLTPDSDTSQQADNSNGFGLHVADYFTPKNEQTLSGHDSDLGSSSPILLPDSVGSATHQQLLVGNNKQGVIYLVDRNNMGTYHGDAQGFGPAGTNNVVQELDSITHGAWCTGAFFTAGSTTSGIIYYATAAYGETTGTGDVAKAFSISNAQINTTPISTSTSSYGTYSYPGSTPILSANGSSGGVLWTLDRIPNRLIAYDANNLGTVLFRSDQDTGNALTGSLVTFHTPTVANGKVYVGAANALNVYGLVNYSTWVAQYGLTGTNALQTAIVSPDGLTNIFKYALGLDPFVTYNPGNPALPLVQTKNLSGTNYLTLSFTGTATDVTYTVQATSNLNGPWATIYTYKGAPPLGTVVVQDAQAVSASSKRFMRLQVSP